MMKFDAKTVVNEHFCPYFQAAVELIGRRWTGVILFALLKGVTRFSELKKAIPDLSEKMLSERLKELEAEEIIHRDVFPETPVRIEYHLTPKGQDLIQVMEVIGEWATLWLVEQ